jgi:hypothetical protein
LSVFRRFFVRRSEVESASLAFLSAIQWLLSLICAARQLQLAVGRSAALMLDPASAGG